MTDTAVFTNEAQQLLEGKPNQLRQEAISEAFLNRGSPIEVTASDVKRARIRQGSEGGVKQLASSFVDTLLHLNTALSACVSIGSVFLTVTSVFRGKIEFFLLASGGALFLVSLLLKLGRKAEVKDGRRIARGEDS